VLGIWIVLGVALSIMAGHAHDWFDSTGEMRYQRLAASIARTHSLVPRIHGELVESWAQLYPALIAPVFHHDYGPQDVDAAHLVNAWVMSSACIPAFLLARRVLRKPWAAYLVAVLTLCVPWVIYTNMLFTEVAAYPAFLWAAFLMHRSISAPSRRNDILALAGIALAFFARTALLTLAFVLPLAILAFELRRRSLRDALRRHDLLVVAYILLALGAIALVAVDRFSRIVGIYSVYTEQANPLTSGYLGSLSEHYATFALGVGILPFLFGTAWMIDTVVRAPRDPGAQAFAWLGLLLVIVIPVSVTSFDVVYNLSFVHDRFFVYLVPLLLIGTVGAIVDQRLRVWTLLPPLLVVVCGYVTGAIPAFTWSQFEQMNVDTPASFLYRPLADLMGGLGGARALLVATTLAIAVAGAFLSRRPVRVLALAYTMLCLPLLTGYVIDRYFSENSWSGRSVTTQARGSLDWVDAAVGSDAEVTIVPYPVSSDWFASQQYWRDLEFWNRSVARDVRFPSADVFDYNGLWFPGLIPRFDPRTGAADDTPTRYAIQSDAETRFRISGPAVAGPSAFLIDAERPWRLDWATTGLYVDGWTKPRTTAQIRIYPSRGQRGSETRYLTVGLRAPAGTPVRRVTIDSNVSTWRGAIPANGSVTRQVTVCVPARRATDVQLSTPEVSAIPGDPRSLSTIAEARAGGLQVSQIALADEVGGPCTPPA
jgi:hypothetical protein